MANSYVDDIKVKISEKYKPPFKISMPMSYSQRLTLNKQLQDNRPMYNFYLETSVLEKAKELREHRKTLVEERKTRIEHAKKEFEEKIQQKKQEQIERLEKEQTRNMEQAKILEETKARQTNPEPISNSYPPSTSGLEQNFAQNYITKNGILMPIPVSTYSTNVTMPKPIPQSNGGQTFNSKPFNISDFESDTSSPFDNMELKSINDLEELAQVLKPNNYQNPVFQGHSNYASATKSYNNLPNNTKSYNAFPQGPQQSTYSQGCMNYSQVPNSFSQINTTAFSQFNTPYSLSSYNVPSAVSNYSNLNGYFYNTPTVTSQVHLGQQTNPYAPFLSNTTQTSLQKSNCKSVPDLVKSVEKELDSVHLTDTLNLAKNANYTTTNVPLPTRPKSTDAVYPKPKLKDEIFNPYDRLSKEQKDLCRSVNAMGFPLDRVARVCLTIGNDQKKIVDHLLALSDLLDLGFSEKDASEALVKNDNDRDKALDLLIS